MIIEPVGCHLWIVKSHDEFESDFIRGGSFIRSRL